MWEKCFCQPVPAPTNASEDRVTAVVCRDVGDQLHDHHSLADTGATEETDLASLGIARGFKLLQK